VIYPSGVQRVKRRELFTGGEFAAVGCARAKQPLNSCRSAISALCTAITCAQQLVVLVGDPQAIATAVFNDKGLRRYTALAARLGHQ
jgi:hypothetical protein